MLQDKDVQITHYLGDFCSNFKADFSSISNCSKGAKKRLQLISFDWSSQIDTFAPIEIQVIEYKLDGISNVSCYINHTLVNWSRLQYRLHFKVWYLKTVNKMLF